MVTKFDDLSINKNFKFGVIYMKKGQVNNALKFGVCKYNDVELINPLQINQKITEEELFSNQEHSEAFDNFLNLLGNRIKLKDFKG